MRRPFSLLLVCCAVSAAGCGEQAVSAGADRRAADTVLSFMRTCGQGEFASAGDILTDRARETFSEGGDAADRCSEELGVDPAAARSAAGAAPGDDRPLLDAIGAAAVRSVRRHGDQAEVDVAIAGVPGTAALEESGERMRIATR